MHTKTILFIKTNISSNSEKKVISSSLNRNKKILSWSLDIEDRDHVLRAVVSDKLNTEDIISLIRQKGFYAEELN